MHFSGIRVRLGDMRMWFVTVVAAAVLGAVAAEVIASDDIDFGVAAGAPSNGTTVSKGSRPTFKVRVKEPGGVFAVYLRVSRSPGKISGGLIRYERFIGKMTRKSAGVYEVTPDRAKKYTYPTYWLNRPGTYRWQAYLIYCLKDEACFHSSAVRRLVVK